ncbi:mannose-6-phosphate isomerase [Actinopolymorpha cephalotaxi]|uniref:mannose-6-phosphate isomerase n=1 Tax=Actinopolymorpha cephalotaxi TaxID=504797 RepID=A0A1I2KMR3_9ACTN|nr:mannose-6-phosphate isomerase, class I [Actinopolymorpha cephalotaxi]NYH84528.1 mannose-6-phosphate isomerase [Actinopolymorpha cephalotaxi]SFF67813.1 mannose-6-phosphate isomerase [Actinopolymorpha cephalotaxi]
MQLLDNPIRPYAWGSPTAIPAMLGVKPTGEPQAELWMGAHPGSPSGLVGKEQTLLDLISADPEGELGSPCVREFGPRLPFLLKVLAAEDPLSLQAHPNPAQAKAGFERENADGIPMSAPHRNYKDGDAKPELICALTDFEALVGFRPPAETLEVVGAFGLPELEPLLAQLREQPDEEGVRAAFTMLMTAPADRRRAVVDAVVAGCAGRTEPAADLVRRLGEKHPGDPGVVAALLLNHVRLAPGEALYLPAGNLHAYVHGVGVEILANSDNVLRGGLTGKHIDLPELLRILDFTPRPAEVLTADAEGRYATPADEFRLSRHVVAGGTEVTLDPAGPQILLCVEGTVAARGEAGKVDLTPGRSAWAGAGEGPVTLAGDGVVFRATAGIG